MKKLLKTYGLNSDTQYFEMVLESYVNGQISQAKEQFRAMNRENRKGFIVWLQNVEDVGPNDHKFRTFFDLL